MEGTWPPYCPFVAFYVSLRGACCKHVFVQLWGLYLWKVSTAFLFRGIIGYNTVKVGDAGGNFADNMSLLLLKEGWSKQYAFCNVFFKASSDLLFFFFFLFLCQMNFCSKCMLFIHIPLNSSEFHFCCERYITVSRQLSLECLGRIFSH